MVDRTKDAGVDIAILTPLPVEWDAIERRLESKERPPSSYLTVLGDLGPFRVVLSMPQAKGGYAAAEFTRRLVDEWNPRWLMLAGVAGGFADKGLHTGDVVVASRIYGYEYGKIEGGAFHRRPDDDFLVDPVWLSYATYVAERESDQQTGWQAHIVVERPDGAGPSMAYVGPIASGEKLVDDPTYVFFEQALDAMPELYAVEMESAGTAAAIRAVQADRAIGLAVIRGISDIPRPLDPSDHEARGTEQRACWKEYAADAAAAFIEHLLKMPGVPAPMARQQRRAYAGDGDGVAQLRRKLVPVGQTVEPVDFVGRDDQLKQLDLWFYDSGVPLAGIIGPPGVGKTWLIRKWSAQLGSAARIIDASAAFVDSPDKLAAFVLDRIAVEFGWNPATDEPIPLQQLASWLREAEAVFIIDQLEYVLTAVGKNVGRSPATLLEFLTAAAETPKGPGRLLFASKLRPAPLAETSRVEAGQIVLIGGESRDPWQLGGLGEGDARRHLETCLNRFHPHGHGLGESEIREVVERFGGHPLALLWFAQLTDSDQHAALQDDTKRRPLLSQLNELLATIAGGCSSEEQEFLRLLAILKHPETENFLASVAGISDLLLAHLALDHLRRRCLAEYGLLPRAGYSTHSIAREWVQQVWPRHLPGLHGRVAEAYVEYDEALPASYHFLRAGDASRAKQWRNVYTQRNFEAGARAYFDGDYDMARDASTDFIEALKELPQTAASPIYLSRAHVNRAVSQHHVNPDWKSETADLWTALELWPQNAHALTFYLRLLSDAQRAGRPWSEIEAELHRVVPIAESAMAVASNLERARVARGLLGLLCWWAQRVPSRQQRAKICSRLRESIAAVQTIDKAILDETICQLWIQALLLLARDTSSKQERTKDLSSARKLAERACGLHRSSGELLVLRASAYLQSAHVARTRRDTLKWLQKSAETIRDIEDSVLLPAGFARLFAAAVEEASHFQDLEKASAALDEALNHLALLTDRYVSVHPASAPELASANVRLLLRSAELDPERRSQRRAEALKVIRPFLDSPTKLTPEVADAAIRAFVESTREESPGDPTEEELTQEILNVRRTDLPTLDQAIIEAKRVQPSDRYDVLRLRLRVQYLTVNWPADSASEPKMVEEAVSMALELGQRSSDEWALLTIGQLWTIIATRTFSPERFAGAVQAAEDVFQRLRQSEYPPEALALRRARFLRATLDYEGARNLLRDLVMDASPTRTGLHAVGLFLDVVAHSLHWSKLDEGLLADAKLADKVYRDYLQYLNSPLEDVNNLTAARRTISWLRCRHALGEVDPNTFSWVDQVYEELSVDSREAKQMRNVQILGELSRRQDPLAQVLGTHIQDGSMWREVGTFLSAALGSEQRFQERALRFWRIAEWWLSNPSWSGRLRGRRATRITQLNMARALLEHPVNSSPWRQGEGLLRDLAEPQRMAWIYHRYILNLLHWVHTAVREGSPTK